MKLISLYVKTHMKTGLKYLGKTSNDPYTYKGSGKKWKNHINKHGNDVWTNVVFQSVNEDEISEMGSKLSAQWNIVESDEWANLKPETGDGGFVSDKRYEGFALSKPWLNSITETKRINNISRKWLITFPNGKTKTIKNIKSFCRDNGLNPGHMSSVSKGKLKEHKGYSCKKVGNN